jgi:hypothetical protein
VFGLIARDPTPLLLDPEARAQLTALYHDEVERLATIIQRDLSHWLDPSSSTSDLRPPS